MSGYPVVIYVKNLTKREIQNRLRSAFGANISETPIVNNSGSVAACYQTCTSAGHFGCVHWTDDDLQIKFKELGVPMTQQILDLVRSGYVLRHIDDRMVRAGWEVIKEAIVDAESATMHG